ncbi:protein TolA, partial [Paracoccus sp. (in: a-proteobacteria)]|nr:protein TolA [Paracoccus sp. (in: a-proteobacteria)]
MADFMQDDRESRIGWWISGGAHAALILWAVLGGVFFRPQPSTPLRTTQVATMSGDDFEALAAASRGAGPVAREATAVAAMPPPEVEQDKAAAPAGASAPDPQDAAQALARPDAAERQPDLSDFEARPPVTVATDLPEPVPAPDSAAETATPDAPTAEGQPARPQAPVPDAPAVPVAPRSELALDRSSLP